MKTGLLVMNPRAIPECIDAIREIRGVTKVWMSYYHERELVDVVRRVIDATDCDRYMILSDDCVPTQATVDLVLALHDSHPDAVACAWINVDAEQPYSTVQLVPLSKPSPSTEAYTLSTIDEVRAMPCQPARTYFHGMNLATLSREQWHRYPFDTYGGFASDYHQCWRLQADDVPIYTHPAAYMHHVKERQNALDVAPEKQLLVGKRAARVTIEAEL